MINPTFFSQSLTGRCYSNRCLARIGKNGVSTFILCAVIHNGSEDRNVDTRVNTANGGSTSDTYLVNFCPVTPKFCRRVCTGRTTRWTLPRISSSVWYTVYWKHCKYHTENKPRQSIAKMTFRTFCRTPPLPSSSPCRRHKTSGTERHSDTATR